MMSGKRNIVWTPQAGPQKALIDCPLSEIFYGGARGGGKTDGVLGKYAIKAARYGRHFNAVFFRKELPMLDDAIERSAQIYGKLGATWHEQKKMWRFRDGGRLRFRPLERRQDAEKYQGQNITDCCVEEAGNYPDPAPIDRLHGVLRSAHGVPTQLILTGNPGGPGQFWIKDRYIDPAPDGLRVLRRSLPGGREHRFVFIPSKLQQNKALIKNDPDYINRLYLVGSEQLVKAWLDGDWGAIEGAYFDVWQKERHVLRPFEIPSQWKRFRSGDWGSARPFSFGWWAIVDDWFQTPDGQWLPRGALVRYREWYGKKEPNVGLKLTAEQVGAGIAEREQCDPIISVGVLDPAAFAQDGGPSIAERIYEGSGKTAQFRRADNKRVPQAGAMGGWDQMRGRLIGEDFGEPYGERPMIYTFSTCADSIRTIPVLQHDTDRPEDLDTDGEDHCFVAGTLVDTDCGPVPIEQLVPGKHRIWSAGAWRWNYAARLTQFDAEVVRLTFADGLKIVCTPDHRFMNFSGEWRYAKALTNEDIACDLSSSPQRCKSSKGFGITSAVSIFRSAANAFTEKFGKKTSDRSQSGRISTIRMAIDRTMIPPTWIALRSKPIWARYTAKKAASEHAIACQWLERLLPDGTGARLADSGTAIISTDISARAWSSAFRQFAKNAARNIWSWQPRLNRANTAAIHVAPVRCVNVEKAGRATVYCLTEPVTEAFTIHGGLIVHNCADEWRYACMSRPYARKKPKDKPQMTAVEDVTLNHLWKAHKPKRSRI